MEAFIASCSRASAWPLTCHRYSDNSRKSYADKLTRHEKILCEDERSTKVDIWQCQSSNDDFSERRVCSEYDARNYFNVPDVAIKDPISRFVFLHAKNSRSKLYVSVSVLKQILTYHQVMPSIVDPFLSFGKREKEADYSATGFRQETHLTDAARSLLEIGRSGHNFELWYSLRTIEPKKSEQWGWTVRQTSTYHSFDVDNGRSVWLIVKGDTAMRDRVHGATQPGASTRRFGSLGDCHSSAMNTHLIVCEWAAENWRQCIKALEAEVHSLTHKSVSFEIKPPKLPTRTPTFASSDAATAPPTSLTRQSTPSLKRSTSRLSQLFSRRNTANSEKGLEATVEEEGEEEEESEDDAAQFSFDDLQTIQTVEERTSRLVLLLRTNREVLDNLKNFYVALPSLRGCPDDIVRDQNHSIAHFAAQINNIAHEMSLQQAHLETLMRLLADRKQLVCDNPESEFTTNVDQFYGILEYRNMAANEMHAQRAEQAQEDMRLMTRQMNELAERTQQETVSMRIITLVTLFFLPGTFICVRPL